MRLDLRSVLNNLVIKPGFLPPADFDDMLQTLQRLLLLLCTVPVLRDTAVR